jgi:integrase
MIELQRLTGCRPGEIVAMRCRDLNTSGKVWTYSPMKHKTAHHGHSRTIFIGPRAQAVLRRWLKPDLQAYLFSPIEAQESLHAELRRKRKTPVQPSQQRRKRKAKPKRAPRDCYSVGSYGRAIARGCRKADRQAHKQNPSVALVQMIIPHWHPHQLRHNAATWLRKEFGLDVARVILGHRSPAITETYAEVDHAKAIDVMTKVG